MVNLFKTLYNKFYQNKPSITEAMTKTFGLLFISIRYWNSEKIRLSNFT